MSEPDFWAVGCKITSFQECPQDAKWIILNKTSLPLGIEQFIQLEILNLDYNFLSELPQGIIQLHQLRALSCWKNSLFRLPDGFSALALSLVAINLGSNQFTEFPIELTSCTKLERLEFFSNQLTSLPEEIEKITNLKFLNVSNNHLSSLPESIVSLCHLKELIIMSNPIRFSHFDYSGFQKFPKWKHEVELIY